MNKFSGVLSIYILSNSGDTIYKTSFQISFEEADTVYDWN